MEAAVGAVCVEGCCNSIIGFICKGIGTLVNVHSNIKSLQNELDKLSANINTIKEDIESAEPDQKYPSYEVKVWLNKGEQMEHEVQLMLEEISLSSGCNVFHRYRIGKAAKKKCLEVRKLIDLCSFPTIFVEKKSPMKAVEKLQAQSLVGQRAAQEMLDRLVGFLEDNGVKRIAVWGMGGVGKTTLVKNFNNKLESSSLAGLLDLIIWVKVSRNVDLKKIQSDIAARLSLEFEAEESIQGRASKLFRRLMKIKKLVLILDDVWENIDLEAVGVPQCEDQANCKIIITTRNLIVCRDMKTDVEMKLDVLNEAASWSLFAQNAGNVVELEGIESLARAVSKECCGLPLAIKTVARSMRNKTMIELWKDALNKFQHSAPHFGSIEKEVYLPLKLSYDSLSSKIHKCCFLYCSLYPENFSIKTSELVQCWIADGLVEKHPSLEESFNAATTLIEYLKDCCLLEQGESTGTVRMHDVVRDVAIWISSYEEESGFYCQSGILLSEIMPQKLHRHFRRISFMNNIITRLPSKLLGCAELTMLFLQGNPLKKVPDAFFRETRLLRILNLSGTRITSLPSSLLNLRELRVLFLRNCSCLQKLPALAALRELQVLDLSGTGLRELPKEVGKLSNLRELNLSCTHLLEKIEPGTISRLSSLEALDMSFSAYKWAVETPDQDVQKAGFGELVSLKLLSVLHITLDNVDCIALRFDWLRRLRKFSVRITPTICYSNYLPTQHDEKRVILRMVDLLDRGLEGLLCSASALDLINCGGIRGLCEIVSKTSLYGLPSLKSLTITSCNWIMNMINGEEIQGSILPNLQCLTLRQLPNLHTILKGNVPREGFLVKLKTIEVVDCPRLTSLFSYVLLKQVQNLEEIRVTNCKRMECVFPGTVPKQVLQKLKVIELKNSVNLRTICSKTPAWSVLERIEVINCPKLEKLPLSARNVITVNEIRGDLRWWNNLTWEDCETVWALQQRFQPCVDSLQPLIQEDEQA